MNQQKIRYPKSFKIKVHASWPMAGIIALIAFLAIGSRISHADTLLALPNAAPSAAQIVTVEGGIKFRRGEENKPRLAIKKDRLSNRNEALIVPGVSTGNKPLSTMAFILGEKQYANLLIQAGPHPNQTQYIFPCQVRGGKLSVGWGPDGECSNEGLLVLSSSLKKSQLLPANPPILLASKNLEIAQANQAQERDYTIQGNKGDQIEINATSRDFDTYLTLLDLKGNVITQNDNVDPKNTNSRMIATLPYTGVYAVLIKNLDGKGGRYTITWKIKSLDSVNTLYGYFPDYGAPSNDYLIVKPASNLATYTQVEEVNSGIQVLAISGNVLVISPGDVQGFILEEGKQYTYTNSVTDTIKDIGQKSTCNSPEYKAFIDPKNWSSPYLSEPVKNAIDDHLRQYPVVLACQPPKLTCTISSNVNEDTRQLFQLVNKYRENNSLPCLQFDDRLARVAQVYADNLSSRKTSIEEFSKTVHIAIYPDRTTTICDRFFDEGYYTDPFGELAALAGSPLRAFQLWTKDPFTLLDKSYTHTGFGVRNGSGLNYYVQTFGKTVNTTKEDMAFNCTT